MELRIEFDRVNRVLLVQLSGPLTNDSPAGISNSAEVFSHADARAFITDVAEATVRPNIIVAPQADAHPASTFCRGRFFIMHRPNVRM